MLIMHSQCKVIGKSQSCSVSHPNVQSSSLLLHVFGVDWKYSIWAHESVSPEKSVAALEREEVWFPCGSQKLRAGKWKVNHILYGKWMCLCVVLFSCLFGSSLLVLTKDQDVVCCQQAFVETHHRTIFHLTSPQWHWQWFTDAHAVISTKTLYKCLMQYQNVTAIKYLFAILCCLIYLCNII